MSDYTFPTVGVPTGWQCPVCKRVYSPSIQMCLFCGNQSVTVNGGNYSGDDIEISYIPPHSTKTTFDREENT